MKIIIVAVTMLLCNFVHAQGSTEQAVKKQYISTEIIKADNNEPVIEMGMFIKMHAQQLIDDSLIADTRDGLPMYTIVDSSLYSSGLLETFLQSRKGDSIIGIIPTDSLQYKSHIPLAQNAKFFKTTIKIEEVFKDENSYKKDYDTELELVKLNEEKEKNTKKISEEKIIADYLNKQNIKTVKTKNGVFVQIIKKGSGKPTVKGQKLKVKYTGKTFSGEAFDSNIDPKFGHPEPFEFTIGEGNTIPGWEEGMLLFNEGGKGTLYIPSNMAYWKQGAGEDIKPYENLIFDIEILPASIKKIISPLEKRK
ncbi:MAG: FKBP-type peptidyl-prolyl cis-trans isomerase [Chitinophagaceae bacterium]|nr:FKBP-type peptidyl-prolyl cis-trans isomerase [Chitinophagaceae bacterium]